MDSPTFVGFGCCFFLIMKHQAASEGCNILELFVLRKKSTTGLSWSWQLRWRLRYIQKVHWNRKWAYLISKAKSINSYSLFFHTNLLFHSLSLRSFQNIIAHRAVTIIDLLEWIQMRATQMISELSHRKIGWEAWGWSAWRRHWGSLRAASHT